MQSTAIMVHHGGSRLFMRPKLESCGVTAHTSPSPRWRSNFAENTRQSFQFLSFHAVFARFSTNARCGMPYTLTLPPSLLCFLLVLQPRLPARLQQQTPAKEQQDIPTIRHTISTSNETCLLSMTGANQIACLSTMPPSLSS